MSGGRRLVLVLDQLPDGGVRVSTPDVPRWQRVAWHGQLLAAIEEAWREQACVLYARRRNRAERPERAVLQAFPALPAGEYSPPSPGKGRRDRSLPAWLTPAQRKALPRARLWRWLRDGTGVDRNGRPWPAGGVRTEQVRAVLEAAGEWPPREWLD